MFNRGRAFAGLKEGLVYSQGNFKASLLAEQTIPSSTSLNTERSEEEEMPSFNAQTLQLELNEEKFKGTFGATLFQFENLPSKVAFESSIKGNSVGGSGIENSYFIYDFNGYAINSAINLELYEGVDFVASIEMIENKNAPSGNSRGQLASAGPVIKLGDNKLTLRYGQFFAEPDVAPAYYMNFMTGGSNRVGQFGRLEMEFSKFNFKIVTQLANIEPINARVHQDSLTNFIVRLETLYVSF